MLTVISISGNGARAGSTVLSRCFPGIPLPVDLEPITKAQGTDKTVIVQTSLAGAETDFLLELAETSGFVGGIAGWLSLESPQFADELERYRRKPYFVGVRPMLECLAADDCILRRRVTDSLSVIAHVGVTFDFLAYTRHLLYVLNVLERIPSLRAVIDHWPSVKSRPVGCAHGRILCARFRSAGTPTASSPAW